MGFHIVFSDWWQSVCVWVLLIVGQVRVALPAVCGARVSSKSEKANKYLNEFLSPA